MKSVSDKLHLPPDILEGATVINVYGKDMALVENYKSIINYSYLFIFVQNGIYIILSNNQIAIS